MSLHIYNSLESAKPLIDKFVDFCANKQIILNDENFKIAPTIGIYVEYPNILQHLCEKSPDKEGLYKESELLRLFYKNPAVNGYYYTNDYMPMAHNFFRRSYSIMNNYAPQFISKFWRLSDSHIDKYIALDNDRVRINVDNSQYIELDTWYGAHFSKDIEQIKDGNVVMVPPASILNINIYFDNIEKLDIKWSSANGIKEFEAEEITSNTTLYINGIAYRPIRYLHSEYDIAAKCFRHLDGAIHLYTSQEFDLRRYSDMNFNQKNSKQIKPQSVKLFKMNGCISVDIWSEYVCQFFVKNPLIYEYFTGQYPQYIQAIIDHTRANR